MMQLATTCRCCGVPIEQNIMGRSRMFCSRKCSRHYNSKPLPPTDAAYRECLQCGKPLLKRQQFYCSRKCGNVKHDGPVGSEPCRRCGILTFDNLDSLAAAGELFRPTINARIGSWCPSCYARSRQ